MEEFYLQVPLCGGAHTYQKKIFYAQSFGMGTGRKYFDLKNLQLV